MLSLLSAFTFCLSMKPIESRFFLTFFGNRSFTIVPTGNCTFVQDSVEPTEMPDEDISDSLKEASHSPTSNQERGDDALEREIHYRR